MAFKTTPTQIFFFCSHVVYTPLLMRIGIDLSPLAYGNRTRGIGTYAENLIAALAAQDSTNEYLLLTASRFDHVSAFSLTLPHNFSSASLSPMNLGLATALVSHQLVLPFFARAQRLDVLHTLDIPFNPSHPGLAYWQRVPNVVTLFDVMPLKMSEVLLKNRRYRRFYELQLNLCRRAAQIITASEASARDLAQYGIAPREKISVIPLAAPAIARDARTSQDVRVVLEGAPFLLHVGGDEPQKNQAHVLRAFGILCRNPAFKQRLVLVGQHHLPDELALEASTRAALRILRLSNVTRAEMDTLYANCAGLIFPSLYEGFGLPVLEAMRSGAPVITSNISALSEVAGDAAILIDPKDINALVNAIRRISEDERLRVKLSEAGERRAQEFTWTRTAEMTRAVYERAARETPLKLRRGLRHGA